MEEGELPKAVKDYSKDLEPSLEPETGIMDVESPQTGDDKMAEVVVESTVTKDDKMNQVVVEVSPLAKDDNLANAELPLSRDDHKDIEPPLSETEIEQPSVAVNDNKPDDVEPLVEPKENVVEGETTLAKDHNLEHPLAEPGNQEQVEPPTARSNSMDVQSQLAKSDNREDVAPPLARTEDTATAGKLF